MVRPVDLERRLADHVRHSERDVAPREAVVRAGAEDEPVLGLRRRVARDPAVRVERLRVRVRRRVVQRRVARRHDHGALGHGVGRRHGEVPRCQVRHEDDGRPVPQQLLDHGARVRQRLVRGQVEGPVGVAAARGQVLGAQAVEHVGALREDLEQPGRGAARGVLGREQEGEHGLADLLVGEVADQVGGPLGVGHGLAGREALAVPPRLHHVPDPLVDDAVGRRAGGHVGLAGGGAPRELGLDGVGRALAPPALGPGHVHGQRDVDELEGRRDQVEVVGDALDGRLRDVITKKGAARQRAVDLPEVAHERRRPRAGGRASRDEAFKVVAVHFFLYRQVGAEGLVREQARQAPAVFGVGLAGQKDPGGWLHDRRCDGD